ncbi:MAG: hypothetical protein KGQ41_09445, partial [Alphaproteobacteria bacterium]|nr:hypothetical protein [Alphaproteobacteria bacterium]
MGTKTKHKKGQRKNAGLSAVRGIHAASLPQAQAIALRMMVWAMCVGVLLMPPSSTLSDHIQKLVQQSLAALRADQIAQPQVQERVSLLRRVAGDADAISRMEADQLLLLFGEPALERREAHVHA